jgi:hypothetical protein
MFNLTKAERLKNQISKVQTKVFESDCEQLQTVELTPQLTLKKRPPIDIKKWSESQKTLWNLIDKTHDMRFKEDEVIPSKYPGVSYLHEVIKLKNEQGKFTGETRRKIQFG